MPNTTKASVAGMPTESDVRRAASEAIVGGLAEIVADAQREWPVDTGRSRDGLRAQVTSEGARINNPVPYAEDVRLPRRGVDAWDRLIVDVVAKREREIADTVAELLAGLVK